MFDLRRELMAHLQKLDVQYFDRNPVGRLVTRVTTDVDVLNDLFSSGLVTILGDLLVLALRRDRDVSAQSGLTLIHARRHAVRHPGDRDFPPLRVAAATAASASPSRRSTPTCRST